MKLLLFITFIISIITSFSQEATFSLDTTRISKFKKNGKYRENISAMEWIIDGKHLKFGDPSIKVKITPNKLDTIYFKGYLKLTYDTIICDIEKPENYILYYNTCCGAFNIHNSENEFIPGSINFKIINDIPINEFLGILGEAGIKLGCSDTLKPKCRSMLSPNIYPVQILQIDKCLDSLDCKETCLTLKNDNKPFFDYNYKELKKVISFLYMPLSISPLIIEIDTKSETIFINKKRLVTQK